MYMSPHLMRRGVAIDAVNYKGLTALMVAESVKKSEKSVFQRLAIPENLLQQGCNNKIG